MLLFKLADIHTLFILGSLKATLKVKLEAPHYLSFCFEVTEPRVCKKLHSSRSKDHIHQLPIARLTQMTKFCPLGE